MVSVLYQASLNNSIQWFNQILIYVLLRRYFVDTVDIYNYLTLSEGDDPE